MATAFARYDFPVPGGLKQFFQSTAVQNNENKIKKTNCYKKIMVGKTHYMSNEYILLNKEQPRTNLVL